MRARPTRRAWQPFADLGWRDRRPTSRPRQHGADLVVNATNGGASIAALEQAGAANLAGKPLLDVSNELVPVEGGGFPRPAASPDNSLGQRIQAAFPDALVVKALNTMNNTVMADPSLVPGDHVVFLSGNDAGAKDAVREVLATFGWRPVQMVDLGGIETAAATEMMMSLWMAVMMARGLDKPPVQLGHQLQLPLSG